MRKFSLYVLAFGTFGLGMAEFGMMSILSVAAAGLQVSVPEAGHFISAYALGVCFGAVMLTFLAQGHSLKSLLIALMLIMCFGNMLAAVAPNYGFMIAARFISGLPHGGYFGVAGIVAKRLASKKKQVQAVAIMISGMTVANLLGIPLAAYITHIVSWHMLFAMVVGWGLWTVYCIHKWVPNVSVKQSTDLKSQFAFLKKPLPWLLMITIMLGNGGIFCWYSYISPIMLHEAGFSAAQMSWVMVVAGLGMVLGNIFSGKLSLYLSPTKLTAIMIIIMFTASLSMIFSAHSQILALAVMFLGVFGLFGVSGPEQYLIIDTAKGGEILGASGAQVAFNLGNAVGAYVGGLPIAMGYANSFSALPGVFLTVLGLITIYYFSRLYEKENTQNIG